MKNNILILVFLTLTLFFKINAQTNEVEQIKYSKDSIPILVKFKTDSVDFNHSDAKVIIKKYLKLSRDDDLKTIKSFTDDSGFLHERFQYFFKGLKVEFSEYTVHSKYGKIESISGTLKPVKSINTKPDLTENEAFNLALKHINAEVYMWEVDMMENQLKKAKRDASATYYPIGELVIWRDWKLEKACLAYKFDVYSQSPFRHDFIYVNAHNGEIIDTQQILKNDAVTGIAATRYSGNINLTTDSFTGGFRLRDPSRGNGIETMDMNTGTIISSAVDFIDNDNNWTDAEWNNTQMDNTALDAHHASQLTYDYFGQSFINRNGWDGSNSILRLYVHFDNNWNNAGWDPSANHIILGDGDGILYNPLADLDIIAHEFGHGISDDEIGLNSNGEPGAIDEGLSDIWAACVEDFAAIPGNDIWVIGEDVEIDVNHRRNSQNPANSHYHENNDPSNPPITYPGTYLGTGWYSGSWDFSGRHINCTVFSHWFFLLSEGGTGTNDNGDCFNVAGIGMTDAARIVYRLETAYLTSNSTFTNARVWAIDAARSLFGPNSNQVTQTTNAWYAVGVGDEYQYTISGPSTVCSSSTTFTINNLPDVDSIIWEPGPYLTVYSGQNTNSPVIKATGNGSSWVTARLVTDCRSITLPQQEVWAGAPKIANIDGPTTTPNNQWAYYTAQLESTLSSPTDYNWILNPLNGNSMYDYGQYCDIAFYNFGSYQLVVQAKNTCSEPNYGPYYVTGIYVYDTRSLSFSPNPTTGETTLTIESGTESETLNSASVGEDTFDYNAEWDMEIYSPMQALKTQKTKLKGKSTTIQTAGWTEGVYTVRVKYKDEILTGKLIVKR